MSGNVFANGKEVAAKNSDDQTLAAMPDVCLTPPPPPAGPLPIPYPNFSAASDTTDGTKSVKIAGDEVGMKDQSSYKTSKGDEAATKSQGMGVSTGGIQGTTFFAAWSSDVMFEGANAIRFMDMTTHNHGSGANSVATGICKGRLAAVRRVKAKCEELEEANEDTREDLKKSSNKKISGPGKRGRGTTVASSSFISTRGLQVNAVAHNFQDAQKFSENLVDGGTQTNRKRGKSGLCAGAYKHPKPSIQKSGHAEARTFDQLGRNRHLSTGAIVFNIDWRPSTGRRSKMPCEDCHKMMCAASQKCNVRVFLCDKKGKPQEVPCPADDDSYEDLQEAMGEA